LKAALEFDREFGHPNEPFNVLLSSVCAAFIEANEFDRAWNIISELNKEAALLLQGGIAAELSRCGDFGKRLTLPTTFLGAKPIFMR
jgi:tRNA isopentenyl-2-thiomethyl-A-37 hydroxylase MiaE